MLFALLCAGSSAQQQGAANSAKAAIDLSPKALVEANFLEKPGGQPFHFTVSFHLFDLTGDPFDEGTLEYWWADSDGTYLTVTSPRLGTMHLLDYDNSQSADTVRSLWLLRTLMDQMTDPPSGLSRKNVELAGVHWDISGNPMMCVHVTPKAGEWRPPDPEDCFDEATGTLRTVFQPAMGVLRNRPALFAGTRLGLDTTIEFSGITAISATIESLQSFQSSGTQVPLRKHPDVAGAEGSAKDAHHFVGPKKISGNAPVYPAIAKVQHKQGTVLLFANITRQGTVEQVVPLASPDPHLTQAALEAVKTWKYQPLMRDGEPMDLRTIMTVNFGY